MGWQVSRRTNKKGEKQYRLWTTISDRWLTTWGSRKDMLQYITDDALYDYKKRVIELYYRFPHDFSDRDRRGASYTIQDDEGWKNWMDWLDRLGSKKNAKEYYGLIDEEFEKVKKELDAEEKDA